VRHFNPEIEAYSTIVSDEDGSLKTFGDDTVAFLTNCSQEEMASWMEAFSCHQCRGLCHEIGQRLLEGSRMYHEGLDELEKLLDQLNYKYFGLNSNSSEKDLDNAYRRLARKMHPDKNGGTEEAKRKFQHMKERYEALKKKFSDKTGDAEDDETSQPQIHSIKDVKRCGPSGTRFGVHRRSCAKTSSNEKELHESEAEPSAESDVEEKTMRHEYDPKDKRSMMDYVSKMAQQLHAISEKTSSLMTELAEARTYLIEEEEK